MRTLWLFPLLLGPALVAFGATFVNLWWFTQAKHVDPDPWWYGLGLIQLGTGLLSAGCVAVFHRFLVRAMDDKDLAKFTEFVAKEVDRRTS